MPENSPEPDVGCRLRRRGLRAATGQVSPLIQERRPESDASLGFDRPAWAVRSAIRRFATARKNPVGCPSWGRLAHRTSASRNSAPPRFDLRELYAPRKAEYHDPG